MIDFKDTKCLIEVLGKPSENNFYLMQHKTEQKYAILCKRSSPYSGSSDEFRCMQKGDLLDEDARPDWTTEKIVWFSKSGELLENLRAEGCGSECFKSWKSFHRKVMRMFK